MSSWLGSWHVNVTCSAALAVARGLASERMCAISTRARAMLIWCACKCVAKPAHAHARSPCHEATHARVDMRGRTACTLDAKAKWKAYLRPDQTCVHGQRGAVTAPEREKEGVGEGQGERTCTCGVDECIQTATRMQELEKQPQTGPNVCPRSGSHSTGARNRGEERKRRKEKEHMCWRPSTHVHRKGRHKVCMCRGYTDQTKACVSSSVHVM